MFSIPFELDRNIKINKPISDVYSALADFNTWSIWSPWIIQEPSCPVTVSGEPATIGHQQAWQGARIGSGRMELIETNQDKRLAYDLFFISPWKSHSKTQFELTEITNEQGEKQTKVTWYMQGTLPFFLFFMKKMMSVFVGGDYERGLKMFKQYVESGKVTSSVEIKPPQQFDGFHYIGYQAKCHVSETPKTIGPKFQQLMTANLPKPDMVLTVINQFDVMTGQSDMTAALGYKQKPDLELLDNMIEGHIADHKAVEAIHTGSYHHLANGWVTAMNYLRFAKLKQNKRAKEYEIYVIDPSEVPEEELLTSIRVPIK